MSKQKKYRKTLNVLGKTEYEFDFNLEKRIYMNLCHLHMKKREEKSLREELKFNTYKKWKNYVYTKYKNYDEDKLNEFSRYLNQRIRNIKPGHEYWNLLIPVIVTIFFAEGIDFLFEAEKILVQQSGSGVEIFFLIYLLLFIGMTFWIAWQTLVPIWNRNIEENILADYKEIIDSIINEKKIGSVK